MSANAGAATPYILALASTEQLLDELVRRNALTICSATVLIDGRAIEKSAAEGLGRGHIRAHAEVRALEVMSRAMATANPRDCVHRFSFDPAHGDYAPGTMVAEVKMLAVGVSPA